MQIYYEGEQASLFAQDCLSGKTYPEPSPAERPKAKISALSLKKRLALQYPDYMYLDLTTGAGNLVGGFEWETRSPLDGGYLMLNTGESPRDEEESSLSQILQERVPEKYYLSPKSCLSILRRAWAHGKELPWKLREALLVQAGIQVPEYDRDTGITAYHINQRNEGIDLHGVAGALMATQNMQMQTFVTGTMCLNDQGGQVMDVSEDVSGTLRAQEHGHQPLVFGNHGMDGRCDGPLNVMPTVGANYGSGGNNIPLVEDNSPVCIIGNVIDRGPKHGGNSIGCQKNLCYTITTKDRHAVFTAPKLLRRLTPLECERLQGFPDGWTDVPTASDSARYRALGNSVAIPCVDYLMGACAALLRDMYK